MTYAAGFENDQVYIGASSVVMYDIYTKGGSVISPMDMEFIMPFNTSAVLSVCRLEILYVGKNMPCLNVTAVNNSVIYTSK